MSVLDNKNSQYDFGQIIKESHDFYGKRIRVLDGLTLVNEYYSHVRVNYDGQNRPSSSTYYRGTDNHLTVVQFVADVASSLNNKYFTIRDNPSDKKYHVWYNVGGAGVDPAPSDSIGIEVDILPNDPASVIALATALTIEGLFGEKFKVNRYPTSIEIATVGYGVVTDSIDFNTTFTITNTAGSQLTIAEIDIEYDGNDPIWEGEVLKGYQYDIYSGKFVKTPAITIQETTVDNPAIQNVTLTLANTEYPVVFPNGTQRFMVKVRGSNSKLQVAWNSGQSGTNYFTVERGVVLREESIILTGKTIYIQAPVAGTVIEVMSWS